MAVDAATQPDVHLTIPLYTTAHRSRRTLPNSLPSFFQVLI